MGTGTAGQTDSAARSRAVASSAGFVRLALLLCACGMLPPLFPIYRARVHALQYVVVLVR